MAIDCGQPLGSLINLNLQLRKLFDIPHAHKCINGMAATSKMPWSISYGSNTRIMQLRIHWNSLALEFGIMRDDAL